MNDDQHLKSPEPQDDLQLLYRARKGEWDAFETLMARYEPRVFSLAWRIVQQRQDAEDVTQQTFISVMENLERFREESSLATWIFRIATNQALSVLRKRRGARTVPLDETSLPNDAASIPHPAFVAQWRDDPANLAQRSEVRQLLDEALSQLDEKYRLVFVLRDVEGFSTRETADILGISESNVKVRLLRSRLQLRERLTRALGDEHTRIATGHDGRNGR